MDNDRQKNSLKWATELEKVNDSILSEDKPLSHDSNNPTKLTPKIQESEERDNNALELMLPVDQSSDPEPESLDIDVQISEAKAKITEVLDELTKIDENLKAKSATGKEFEKLQELKTSVTEKKSMLKVYTEVLDNISAKVMPVFYKNSENKNVSDSIAHSVSEILGNVNNEISSAEEVILNVNKTETLFLQPN
jgi:hypothetical protein